MLGSRTGSTVSGTGAHHCSSRGSSSRSLKSSSVQQPAPCSTLNGGVQTVEEQQMHQRGRSSPQTAPMPPSLDPSRAPDRRASFCTASLPPSSATSSHHRSLDAVRPPYRLHHPAVQRGASFDPKSSALYVSRNPAHSKAVPIKGASFNHNLQVRPPYRCAHLSMHTRTHTFKHAQTHLYTCALHTHRHIHLHIHRHAFTYTHSYAHIHIHAHTHACTLTYTHAHIHIHTYTHMHTHNTHTRAGTHMHTRPPRAHTSTLTHII